MTAHDTPSSVGSTEPDELRERPVGDLVKQLAGQTSMLVRQEIDLAKAEMSDKASVAGKGAGLLGGAAVVGLLAAGALTACLILALDEVVPDWLAALIVALVMGAVAAVLALQGRNRVRAATPPVPEQTVETVKEDVEWAKTQRPSART
jgi:Putative Actinobacterial Holin-X, holin superfamily III